jgi:hypothetical protein
MRNVINILIFLTKINKDLKLFLEINDQNAEGTGFLLTIFLQIDL